MVDLTKNFSEDTDLKRDLGLVEAISIVIGRIIGSGIFKTPAPIMALVASTSLFGFVWILGGVVTIFGAVCYAELAAMMPRSGGPYIYLKTAYHPMVAFLRGWAMFFVSETASIAAVALVFSDYFNALWKISTGFPLPHFVVVIIALAVIWLLTVINLFGVYFSGIFQNIFSSIKIVAILGLIILAFSSHNGTFSHFTNNFWPDKFNWETILLIGAALRYSFFAFSGWEGATYVAEEIKNPRKNLPLSLMLGIGGVILLYIGANSAYIYHLSVKQIATSKWVAVDTLQLAIGSIGGVLIALAIMLNTFGNVNSQILVKARTWQAMARDNLFFKIFRPIHSKYKTPNNSLILQSIWASVLLLFASFQKNSYETIIDFFSATSAVFNILTFYSLIVLRKKFPDVYRPYKAWLYPYSLIAVLMIYVAFLIITVISAPISSIIGLLLTSTGFLYYYFNKSSILGNEK